MAPTTVTVVSFTGNTSVSCPTVVCVSVAIECSGKPI
jgi:hypothetical protein